MRIVLADDNVKVRSAIRLLLDQYPEMEIVGEATEAEGLVGLVKAGCPDMVLVDWEMLGGLAQEYMSTMRAHCPGLMVVALCDEPQTCRSAIGANADTCIYRGDPPERLLAALSSCYRRVPIANT